MKALIVTQYMENYGTNKEPYWKFKGGDEYIIEIPGFRFDDEFAMKNLQSIIDSDIRPTIEYSNDYAREYITNFSIVEDDYTTEFEKSQLEYDGVIQFPAKRFVLENEMVLVTSDDNVIGSV